LTQHTRSLITVIPVIKETAQFINMCATNYTRHNCQASQIHPRRRSNSFFAK